ncbi:MAG TPA: hypothetical protein PL110_15170, partial [Candidatus Eremiobacteraeota bacterium]|nr:hypothetical protein [Candidatus Eremiobacteraeota bacterium]
LNYLYDFIFSLGINLREPRYLLIISSLIFIILCYFIIKTKKNLENINKITDIIAIALCILPLCNILLSLGKVYMYAYGVNERKQQELVIHKKANISPLPNIYYIVLDSYAREDILKELFQFDNSEFIMYLRKKGFYVADKSTCNYSRTDFSIASTLNLSYLQNLLEFHVADNSYKSNVNDLVKYNKASKFLKTYDYSFVVFSSGQLIPDICKNSCDIYISSLSINEFEFSLLLSTPFIDIFRDIITPYDILRYRFLITIQKIKETTHYNVPIFAYAHLQGVHTPFVFGEYGEKIPFKPKYRDWHYTKEEYKEGYLKQLVFVNKNMMELIDYLIANSANPPVIILQADHGSGYMVDLNSFENTNFKEKMSILNAYYLPPNNGLRPELYKDISSINTFRFIFNYYFQADLPLVKQRNYFSKKSSPFDFKDVTDIIKDPVE